MSDYRAIDTSTERLFETTLQKIQGQLEVKRRDTNAGLKLLARFEELKSYKSLFVHKVTELKGKSGSFIILLIEKHLTIIQQKRHGRIEKDIEEIEPILLFTLPQNVGRAYIKKETLADKIADLFTKVDIDFVEHPNFSKNYYVVGEKPDDVKRFLPKGLIESLDKVGGMTIEINGSWGLLRSEKNLTEDVLLLLISIGYNITK